MFQSRSLTRDQEARKGTSPNLAFGPVASSPIARERNLIDERLTIALWGLPQALFAASISEGA